jgi:integrase/recombinase XerD
MWFWRLITVLKGWVTLLFTRPKRQAAPLRAPLTPTFQGTDELFVPEEAYELTGSGLPTPLAEPWLKGELLTEAQRFIKTQRSVHTQRAYEGDLKQFISFLRAERAAGDSFDALLAFRDWLVKPKHEGGAGLARISANRKFATVRAFLSWLQSRGKVKDNPSPWVKNFRARTESPTQGFSDKEVALMLEIPNRKTESGHMHSVVLHLLFYLGLRRGELVALRARNIGFARMGERNVMTLRIPGKGDKERVLPVPERTQAVLESYVLRRGIRPESDDYLFSPVKNNVTKTKQRPIATQAVYYMVVKYAKLAGVDRRVSPHSCRATAISNALDHAASHRSVQQMAGWSSPLMIERYDKRRTELRDSAVHVVDY